MTLKYLKSQDILLKFIATYNSAWPIQLSRTLSSIITQSYSPIHPAILGLCESFSVEASASVLHKPSTLPSDLPWPSQFHHKAGAVIAALAEQVLPAVLRVTGSADRPDSAQAGTCAVTMCRSLMHPHTLAALHTILHAPSTQLSAPAMVVACHGLEALIAGWPPVDVMAVSEQIDALITAGLKSEHRTVRAAAVRDVLLYKHHAPGRAAAVLRGVKPKLTRAAQEHPAWTAASLRDAVHVLAIPNRTEPLSPSSADGSTAPSEGTPQRRKSAMFAAQPVSASFTLPEPARSTSTNAAVLGSQRKHASAEQQAEQDAGAAAVGVGATVSVTLQGIPHAAEGQVRFIGATCFARGVWVGVQLTTPQGKHDGAISGVRYFSCPPRHGVFVKPQLVQVIPGSSAASTSGPPSALRTPPTQPSKPVGQWTDDASSSASSEHGSASASASPSLSAAPSTARRKLDMSRAGSPALPSALPSRRRTASFAPADTELSPAAEPATAPASTSLPRDEQLAQTWARSRRAKPRPGDMRVDVLVAMRMHLMEATELLQSEAELLEAAMQSCQTLQGSSKSAKLAEYRAAAAAAVQDRLAVTDGMFQVLLGMT